MATFTLFLGAGVVGTYFVFTVGGTRRRGSEDVGGVARNEGSRLRSGVLGSSEMGYSVCRRLGFEERCRIGVYQWHP